MEPTKYNKYEVKQLLKLNDNQEFRLQRVFAVYKQQGAKHFYYNIFNTVRFPDVINPGSYTKYKVKPDEPWTLISYKHYNRTDLWWLIACINKIDNTFLPIEPGTELMIPTNSAVRVIIDELKNKT
jgi:nucleoid-associated protein YgaU